MTYRSARRETAISLTFYKNYVIIFIESEGKIMFDDFILEIQSDEIASLEQVNEEEMLEECFDE